MNDKVRLHLATPGCVYFTRNKKIVDQLLATGNFKKIKTYFEYHKWWEFWKAHKEVGYEIMCVRDLEV